jgi:hypothetical protein
MYSKEERESDKGAKGAAMACACVKQANFGKCLRRGRIRMASAVEAGYLVSPLT